MPTFTKRVSASGDDGNGWQDTAENYSYTDTYAEVGNNCVEFGCYAAYAAFRFTNVTIPRGRIVTSAYLKLTVGTHDDTAINARIYGIDEDNTATLAIAYPGSPLSRSSTTAYVDWNLSTTTDNTEYTSPDISSIIQEIIDRVGWSSDNSLGLFYKDDGSSENDHQSFHMYDGDTAKAAYLEITYSEGSTSASPSPSSSASPSSSVSSSISPSSSPSKSASSSISPSASPSPSASVSPSPPPENYGIKISKAGTNVSDIPSDATKKNFTLLSTESVHKVSAQAVISSSSNIAHGLGFIPMWDAYVLTDGLTKAHPVSVDTWSTSSWEVSADATYLYCTEIFGSDSLFYIIYLDVP